MSFVIIPRQCQVNSCSTENKSFLANNPIKEKPSSTGTELKHTKLSNHLWSVHGDETNTLKPSLVCVNHKRLT